MNPTPVMSARLILCCGLWMCGATDCRAAEPRAKPTGLRAANWVRHTIDAGSRGADGIRMCDINGDGRLDLVTGWEEGGEIRVYLQPQPEEVRRPWPMVTVGRVRDPEDAVFVDLDQDGAVDVVSCCEGDTRTVYVHWSPRQPERLLDPAAWRTEAFPALAGRNLWMFALPMQVDGRYGPDLIIGAKGSRAEVGWLQAPEQPRDLAGWTWTPLDTLGWTMSLIARDMDGDGDLDLLLTDRKRDRRGCRWLEHPGFDAVLRGAAWSPHEVGRVRTEVMFAQLADLDGDGWEDVVAATVGDGINWWRRLDASGHRWEARVIPMPPNCGTGKGVHVADFNDDGRLDLVVTCEQSEGLHGVFWLEAPPGHAPQGWTFNPISGDRDGIKFDLIQLLDVDGDGDLDLLTCEERNGLGVVWYETPSRRTVATDSPVTRDTARSSSH